MEVVEESQTPPPKDESKSKSRKREPMQIYRPPGLRNPASTSAPAAKTNGTAQSKKSENIDIELSSNASSESRGSASGDKRKTPTPKYEQRSFESYNQRHQQKFNQQQIKERSHYQHGYDTHVNFTPTNILPKPAKETTPIRVSNIKEAKKKPFTQKEVDEIAQSMEKLNISNERALFNEFIGSNFENEILARSLGSYLVQYAIEENKTHGRQVAKICAGLLESPSGPTFHSGLVTGVMQYFECRDQLRFDHLKVWTNFLSFISDLYSNIGFTYEGELVDIIFNVYEYMLNKPVLETLKIEELECLIASLLSVGYDLERQSPDRVGTLKNLIRDAFVDVHEPWARKMILLLMELSASGWTLPPEANEYYFQ